MYDIMLSNGEVFEGKEIRELSSFIIDKFAEKKLSVDKAKIVLERTGELLGTYATIKPTNL